MNSLFASIVLASLVFPSGVPYVSTLGAEHVHVEEEQQIEEAVNVPQRISGDSLGLKTTADAVVVVDDVSGGILYHENYIKSLPVASITKLMTALVVLETKPDWDEVVEIIQEDYRSGNQVYLLQGEQVTVRDLFHLALVASSNEAAAALARSTGIADFAQAMNAKAKQLGMAGARFVEPTGLDPENIASPYDISKLAQAAFGREEIAEAVTTQRYDFTIINTGRQGSGYSTNVLLNSFLNNGEYTILGAKTGYLDEAGYCLVISVQHESGASVTVTLLGADSQTDRWQEAKGIVDWVFANYQW